MTSTDWRPRFGSCASASRDEVVKIIQDTTGSSEEIARETLKLYFEPDRGVFPKQGD